MFNRAFSRLKRMHRSLTIWFNSVIGTVVVLLPTAQDSFPQLHEYVHPSVYKWGMAVLIVGNILLRFKTTADLAEKGKPSASTSGA